MNARAGTIEAHLNKRALAPIIKSLSFHAQLFSEFRGLANAGRGWVVGRSGLSGACGEGVDNIVPIRQLG